jgi:hypothetical protein
MGHMNQRFQNIRSTSKPPITSDIEYVTVTPAGLGKKSILSMQSWSTRDKLYTDLTRKFPVSSSKGKWYVMVCYVFDYNYVKVVPMNSRSALEWVKAYDQIHQELTSKGFKPKPQTLDKEASTALKNCLTTNDVEYQLAPPPCHHRNADERVIQTSIEYFVAGLSSVDPNFPLHWWDRLLTQAEITLNLLRTSRQHPQLSAAAHFHGVVDYNKTYFAPPVCKIIAHAPHGQHG